MPLLPRERMPRYASLPAARTIMSAALLPCGRKPTAALWPVCAHGPGGKPPAIRISTGAAVVRGHAGTMKLDEADFTYPAESLLTGYTWTR